MVKNGAFSSKKSGLKTLMVSFWACMNSIFHARQFFINSEHILDILRAKKFDRFFIWFQPFFTTRPTSERCNAPLKVIPEGSMVEYLPVGPKEAPQTIFGEKNISGLKSLTPYPSPLCHASFKIFPFCPVCMGMIFNILRSFPPVILCRPRHLWTILSLILRIQTSLRSRRRRPFLSANTGLLWEVDCRQLPLKHRRPSHTTPTPNHRPSLQST